MSEPSQSPAILSEMTQPPSQTLRPRTLTRKIGNKRFTIKVQNEPLRNYIDKILSQFRKQFIQLTLTGAESMIYKNLLSLEKKLQSGNPMGMCVFQACMRYGKSWVGLILLQCIKKVLNPDIKLVLILAPPGSKNNILTGWKEKLDVFGKIDPEWNDLKVIDDEKKLCDETFILGIKSSHKVHILPTTYSWIYGDGSHPNPIGPTILGNFSPNEIMIISDEVHHNFGLLTRGLASPGKKKENIKAKDITYHFGPKSTTRDSLMTFFQKCIHIGFSGTAGEALYYYKMYGISLHGHVESKECIVQRSIQKIDQYDYKIVDNWKTRSLELPDIIKKYYKPELDKQLDLEKQPKIPLKVLISVASWDRIIELEEVLKTDSYCSQLNIQHIHCKSPLKKQDEEKAHIIIGCKKIIEGCTINQLVLTVQTTEMKNGSSAGYSEHRSATSHQFGARNQNPDTFQFKTTQVVLFKDEKTRQQYMQEREYNLSEENMERYNRLDPIYKRFENQRWNYALLRIQRAFNEQESIIKVCDQEFHIDSCDTQYIACYLDGAIKDWERAFTIFDKYYRIILEHFKINFPDLTKNSIVKDQRGFCKYSNIIDIRGYQETNPEDKKIINYTIVDNIKPIVPGKIIVLDWTNFNTSNTIIERYPELLTRLVIPQYNYEHYLEMRKHPKFGKYVINRELVDYIKDDNGPYNTIYADACQTLDTIKKDEWIKYIIPKLNTNSIFAITTVKSTREKKSDFTGNISTLKDVDIMKNSQYSIIPIEINGKTQYEYGTKMLLCTMLFRKIQ